MIWRSVAGRWKPVEWHGSLTGQPVFLVANGPSFADIDAAALCGPGRTVLGINTVYPRLRPDLWVGMDAPECFEQRLFFEAFPKVLRGNYGAQRVGGREVRQLPQTFFVDVAEGADFFNWTEGAKMHWRKDSFTVALQLALWMGAREIYFVGVDLCTDRGDYADGDYLPGPLRARNARLYDQTFTFLRQAIKLTGDQVRWTSCSPGSRLREIMPFRPVVEVVAGIEHALPSGRPKLHVLAAPAPSELEKYLGIYASPDHAGYGHSNHGAAALPLLHRWGATSVLDVGCGWNEFVQSARAAGMKAIGVDFACPGADLRADATALPFPDKTFDFLTAFDCLEHLRQEQVEPALAEFARVAHRFCFSIAHQPSRITWQGHNLHPTVRPEPWWLARLTGAGATEITRSGRYILGHWPAVQVPCTPAASPIHTASQTRPGQP